MKNLLLFCAFILATGVMTAQETKKCTAAEKAACAASGKKCAKGKACCASKASASTDATTVVMSAEAVATLAKEAAASDTSIEVRECAMSGAVAYYQKSECATSGKVSMNEVKYCTKSNAFVNASPSAEMGNHESIVVKMTDTVEGTEKSTGAKKACCKGKKACSKGAASASTDSATSVMSAEAVATLAKEAAAADTSIEVKECAMSGAVSYYQKKECATSGKVSMNEVKYCTKSSAFVNVSPTAEMGNQEAKVIKMNETTETAVKSTEKKACCKGKKACTKKG